MARASGAVELYSQDRGHKWITHRPTQPQIAGVWPVANAWTTEAYAQRDAAAGWDSFTRNTLFTHAAEYAGLWYGIWTGPDSFFGPDAERPGEADAHLATALTDYPALNTHIHTSPLRARSSASSAFVVPVTESRLRRTSRPRRFTSSLRACRCAARRPESTARIRPRRRRDRLSRAPDGGARGRVGARGRRRWRACLGRAGRRRCGVHGRRCRGHRARLERRTCALRERLVSRSRRISDRVRATLS